MKIKKKNLKNKIWRTNCVAELKLVALKKDPLINVEHLVFNMEHLVVNMEDPIINTNIQCSMWKTQW